MIFSALHQEYLKMCIEKGEQFQRHSYTQKLYNSIKTFLFYFQTFNISVMQCPIVLSWRIDTVKNNSGRTRISRWLGRENEEYVALDETFLCSLPSSPLRNGSRCSRGFGLVGLLV